LAQSTTTCPVATPDLGIILRQLYGNEIGCAIASLFDLGWRVRLGDELNGYVAEEQFQGEDFGEIALAHRCRP
jgi:hypothetical protein